MTDLFELNINKYTIKELMDMLNLKDSFTLEDVVQNEDTLRERLLEDPVVKNKKKKDIMNFLDQVKNILLKIAKKNIVNNHDVIKRNHKAANFLNPISRKTNTEDNLERSTINKMVSIDSQFRDNYYNTNASDFDYTMPTVVKNVVSMELCGLEIPNSYYQISRNLGNDYFWLGLNKKWYFIAIPEGSYNRSGMEKQINKQLKYALPKKCNISFLIDSQSLKSVFFQDKNLEHKVEIKLAFNRLRGKSVSTKKNLPEDLPEIDISAPGGIMGKIGWILGYRMAEYTIDSGYANIGDIDGNIFMDAAGYGYISEGVYNGWTNRYFYIIVEDFNKNTNNFIVPTYAASLGSANILARITLDPNKYLDSGFSLVTNNSWENTSTKKRSYFGPVDINKIKFQILDSLGRIVDLNKMDCSFALNMVCLYDY